MSESANLYVNIILEINITKSEKDYDGKSTSHDRTRTAHPYRSFDWFACDVNLTWAQIACGSLFFPRAAVRKADISRSKIASRPEGSDEKKTLRSAAGGVASNAFFTGDVTGDN